VYADENGLLFMETSAKTALNVNEMFLAIGKCASPEINCFMKGSVICSCWYSLTRELQLCCSMHSVL